MDFAKLNPWNWFKKEDEQEQTLPVHRTQNRADVPNTPLGGLHREMDRIFDQALRNFGLGGSLLGTDFGQECLKPSVDVAGSEDKYTVSAELPGMDEKDISVEIQGDALILRGEKKREEEHRDAGYYRVERSYGSFRRVLTLPGDADTEAVKARYRNGVITVTLPRKAAVRPAVRRVAIQ